MTCQKVYYNTKSGQKCITNQHLTEHVLQTKIWQSKPKTDKGKTNKVRRSILGFFKLKNYINIIITVQYIVQEQSAFGKSEALRI